MKIVSWNCRGIGSKIKEEAIRSLIRTETPDILLIQETKLEDFVFLQESKKLWSKCEAKVISAQGASGGLATLWNASKFSFVSETLNTHWLLLKLQHLDSKEIINLFNVYIPLNAVEKKACWDSIRTQADLVNLENIIIAGDLNLTLLSADKRGGNIIRDPAREWAEDLILDRFLIQSSFLLLGLEARVHILPCSTSDHKPIKLELVSQLDLGPIPFRFSPLWTNESDFMHLVKDIWMQPVKCSPFFVWEEKLRRVKRALKTWVKSLPNPANERKNLQCSLENHHLHAETADITKDFLDKEAQLQQNFHKACLAEEEY
eukprot:PITA_11135